MSLIVHDMEQGSPEWFAARAGLPTASEFHTVLAKGKDGGASVTRKKYLYQLAGEIVTGAVAEGYTNAHMERGKTMEAEARDLYDFLTNGPIERVGFMSDAEKGAGCSPDSLVGDTGLLEIKTKLPALAIEAMLRGDFPPEHKAQCQGALWISDRIWIDLAIYWPGLPLIRYRAYRDEDYVRSLAKAVKAFNDELAEIVERVRRYGQPSTLKADLSQSLLMAG
jgi:hypothetical protein